MSDGGRSKYFTATGVGDCVTRAVANATGKDYKEVYDAINQMAKTEKRARGSSSARNGVNKKLSKKYIEQVLGWEWHPTMTIGSGCKVHLREDELPKGNLIVQVTGHLTCVKDGVLYDTFDCTRDGSRCVYGYWTEPTRPKAKPKTKGLYVVEVKNHKWGNYTKVFDTREDAVAYKEECECDLNTYCHLYRCVEERR